VVASTQAAFWAALRLVGASGRLAGYGRLLEESAETDLGFTRDRQ
jgi:maleate cis-trans isomerase